MHPRLRAAAAGSVAALVWGVLEPVDQRLFRDDYSDVAVLGKAFTRGRGWRPLGLALHAAERRGLRARLPRDRASVSRDPRRLAIELALAEHLTLFPTGTLVDRYHPARGEPGVRTVFSAPAFAQATVRHALFGVVLGRASGTQKRTPPRARRGSRLRAGAASGRSPPTGSPSKRSTARRCPRLVFTCSTRAASAGRSHSSSGSRSETIERPPRSTKSAASPPRRTTCAPATRAARPPDALRPGQRRSVGLRWIGRGEHERVRLLALLRTELAEPLDRAAERELRSAEALDEVAAPAEPERLERLQLPVDRAVPADDPLAAHAVAGDDPLPLEEQLGEAADRTGPGHGRERGGRSSDQRPCVAVIPVERRREKRRGRRSGRGTP